MSEQTSQQFQIALESCCAALITMESIERRMRAQAGGGQKRPHLARAIETLRTAIREVREAAEEVPCALATGFVVGPRKAALPPRVAQRDQTSPRRTA